jgi:hypothetical protein
MNKLKTIIQQLNAAPKKLFLTDSLGALLTALLLTGLVATFNRYFGMPQNVLYVLASVACGFAVYSACCYFFVPNNCKPYLRFIGICNLLYCCATMTLVIHFYQNLTALGVLYFAVEASIVLTLSMIELMVVSYKFE